MISYKDFIKLMEERGYTYKNQIMINESNSNIKTFQVKEQTIGKVLELSYPDNTIISACGKSHNGGCPDSYSINIECFNDKNKEPFQELHYSTKLTNNQHVIAELIVTKILNKDPNEIDPNYKDWQVYGNPMLKLINSTHPYEHIMWVGVYKLFSREFLDQSFNLNPNEMMIFYMINPDVDITKVRFSLKADILEKRD